MPQLKTVELAASTCYKDIKKKEQKEVLEKTTEAIVIVENLVVPDLGTWHVLHIPSVMPLTFHFANPSQIEYLFQRCHSLDTNTFSPSGKHLKKRYLYAISQNPPNLKDPADNHQPSQKIISHAFNHGTCNALVLVKGLEVLSHKEKVKRATNTSVRNKWLSCDYKIGCKAGHPVCGVTIMRGCSASGLEVFHDIRTLYVSISALPFAE
ncbi:hypothetical protein ACH5RR_014172 [Cinchona calisaya]|uniref:Uncharacterized protein n=1 Tax=Cinchona calisaya TaxID=153742 RepID=A0ABD3A232_9GENT